MGWVGQVEDPMAYEACSRPCHGPCYMSVQHAYLGLTNSGIRPDDAVSAARYGPSAMINWLVLPG